MHARVEVCPPELFPSSLSWEGRLKRLGTRLRSRVLPWLPAQARPLSRLTLVKREFHDSLADLEAGPALALLDQIDQARSLRELWHLRSPVFGVVAVAHTQSVAEHRLARLNRHFRMRVARTSAIALNA